MRTIFNDLLLIYEGNQNFPSYVKTELWTILIYLNYWKDLFLFFRNGITTQMAVENHYLRQKDSGMRIYLTFWYSDFVVLCNGFSLNFLTIWSHHSSNHCDSKLKLNHHLLFYLSLFTYFQSVLIINIYLVQFKNLGKRVKLKVDKWLQLNFYVFTKHNFNKGKIKMRKKSSLLICCSIFIFCAKAAQQCHDI